MAEIINLRLARKAKRRADDNRGAAVNRARFGQTKAGRQLQQAEASRRNCQLDGARRDSD